MYKRQVFSVNLSFVGGTDLSGYSQYYNKSAAQQVADTFPYLLTSDRMQERYMGRKVRWARHPIRAAHSTTRARHTRCV